MNTIFILLILTDSLVFHCVFLSLYISLIDVLIHSAAQLQECLINLLTYLLTYLLTAAHYRHHDHLPDWQVTVIIIVLPSSSSIQQPVAIVTCDTRHYNTSKYTTVRWPLFCHRWANAQGRINHCAGCTMVGAPAAGGRPNCQILPRCFDVRLKRNDDD